MVGSVHTSEGPIDEKTFVRAFGKSSDASSSGLSPNPFSAEVVDRLERSCRLPWRYQSSGLQYVQWSQSQTQLELPTKLSHRSENLLIYLRKPKCSAGFVAPQLLGCANPKP